LVVESLRFIGLRVRTIYRTSSVSHMIVEISIEA
jgi:hypothetical protein